MGYILGAIVGIYVPVFDILGGNTRMAEFSMESGCHQRRSCGNHNTL
jgi:hypothetical protein